MSTTVKIRSGLYYGKSVRGVFPLAQDFVLADDSKREGYVWIFRDGKKIKLHVNRKDVQHASPAATVDPLQDENLEEVINQRFEVLELLMHGVVSRTIKSCVISGAPGVGKSFTIDRILREAQDAGLVNYTVLKGVTTALGLFEKMHQFQSKNSVLVLDDMDSVFNDESSLNLLKAALDTGGNRVISWLGASSYLRENDIEPQFEFKGTVIFITNLNFDRMIEKGSKISAHLRALQDRCTYLDLRIHEPWEILIRIRHVIHNTTMLDTLGIDDHQKVEIVKFLENNMNSLRSLSLRTLIQLASFVKTSKSWESIARSTLLR